MKQKNNHARSKQKRKALRLKNRMQSIWNKRAAKKAKEFKPKGKTFIATPKKRAVDVARLERSGAYYDFGFVRRLNQRQKRKRYRQAH